MSKSTETSAPVAPAKVHVPKVELVDFKFHPDMSEETNCYSAIVRVDGIRSIHAKNDGNGGCDHYTPAWTGNPERDKVNKVDEKFKTAMAKLETYVATLPPKPSGYENCPPLTMDVELFISDLAAKEIDRREGDRLKRNLKRNWDNMLFATNPKGELVSLKLTRPRAQVNWSVVKQQLLAREVPLKLIEETTFEAAWPLMAKAVGLEISS